MQNPNKNQISFQSEMIHIEEAKIIVKVTAYLNDKILASSLGEHTSAEHAEDRGLDRVKRIINYASAFKEDEIKERPSIKEISDETKIRKNSNINHTETKKELNGITVKKQSFHSDDWSREIDSLNKEIERLKWGKDEEKSFIKSLLNKSSRNMITSHEDMSLLISTLHNIKLGNSPSEAVKNKVDELLSRSSSILKELKLNISSAREILQENFNASSRSELNPKQLSNFVNLLETKLKNETLEHNTIEGTNS